MTITRNLAHGTRLRDSHIHVSMIFKDDNGAIIHTPWCGNEVLDHIADLDINKEDLKHGYNPLPIE